MTLERIDTYPPIMTVLATASRNVLLNREISRGDIGCLLLAEYFVAALPPLDQASSLIGVADTIARQSLFFLFAIFVAAKRFWLSNHTDKPSKIDIANALISTILFSIVCFFGVEQIAGLVLTLIIAVFLLGGVKDKNFRSALLVCLALAINSFWGPLIFQTFTSQIIAFDSGLLKWAYGFLRPDILAQGPYFKTSTGFGIVIVGVCSVFNSASVAFLASTAIGQYVRPGLSNRDVIVIAVVLIIMVLINTCRLMLMGWSPSLFEYWHNGNGGPVIALVQTVIIAVVATVGAIWAARKRSW